MNNYNDIFSEIRRNFPHASEVEVIVRTNQAGFDDFNNKIKQEIEDKGLFVIPNEELSPEMRKQMENPTYTRLATPYGTIKLERDA